MPRVICAFLKQHEQANIRLVVQSSTEVVDQVVGQRCDLGLIAEPYAFPGPCGEHLLRSPLVCALPAGHRLQAKALLVPADLEGEALISYPYVLRCGGAMTLSGLLVVCRTWSQPRRGRMDRSYVYQQFIVRYPDAKEHSFEAGRDRSCSVMVGLFYGVVEVVFVGVYLPDGRFKSEHLYFEGDLCKALGVIRVDPEDALLFGRQRATTTCLTGYV